MSEVYVEESRLPKLVYFFISLFLFSLWIYFLWGSYEQLILEGSFGTKPMSDNGLIIFMVSYTILSFLLAWLFVSMKLSVKVENGNLSYRFPPFINKLRVIDSTKITSWAIKKPKFFVIGLGLRFDPVRNATIYSTGSKYFLTIKLNKGKNLWFSTKNPLKLEKIINKIESKTYE